MKLLYLHGFRSSPDSTKAVLMAEYCQSMGLGSPIIPQLPISPKDAVRLCEKIIHEQEIDAVCGSSLGGFYAMYLAEKYGLRCAVINPAITPWNELQQSHLQQRYSIEEISEDDSVRFLAELRFYETHQLTHLSRYLLLVALGDEVLNPMQMIDFFEGSEKIIVDGGDHSLDDFGGFLPEIVSFLINY